MGELCARARGAKRVIRGTWYIYEGVDFSSDHLQSFRNCFALESRSFRYAGWAIFAELNHWLREVIRGSLFKGGVNDAASDFEADFLGRVTFLWRIREGGM